MKIAARIAQSLLIGCLSLALAAGAALAAEKKEKAKNDYPNATRKDPKVQLTEASQKKLNAAYDAIDKKDPDKAESLLNEVLNNPKASNYEKAAAYMGLSSVAYEKDNAEKAIELNQKAIALDALDNNMQFNAMYQTAQLSLQEEHYDKALEAVDAYLTQSGSTKADAYALKANALYRLEKFDQAAETMKKAISLSNKPSDSWYQILLASYSEANKNDEAAKVAEDLLAKDPTNKRVALQLASIYLENKQDDKALATLEGAYKRGLLTDEKELKQLYQSYNYLNKPKEASEVIQAGIAKGVLKPSFDTYKALGDSYALQAEEVQKAKGDAKALFDQAVKAYAKAGEQAKDGEADYLRGQLLIQELDQFAEGKAAITTALGKGVKHQGEAYVLLGNAEQQLGNDAAATAAYTKAATYPNTKKMAESWLHNMKVGGGKAAPKKK